VTSGGHPSSEPASIGSTSIGSTSSGPTSTRAPHAPDLGPPTTLVLVRHGRTAFTEQGRFSGRPATVPGFATVDPPLSPSGLDDARAVADALLGLGDLPETGAGSPDVLLVSPMQRTRQTAAVIGQRLGLDPVVDEDWIEAGFGVWDGHTFGEVAARWPDELAAWRGSMTVAPPGGGESLQDVVNRIRAARRKAVAAYPGRVVVVVSHVTPVRVCVQEALDAGPSALWRLAVAPCSVTVVRHWSDGGCEVLCVNRVNRVARG